MKGYPQGIFASDPDAKKERRLAAKAARRGRDAEYVLTRVQ